MGKPMGNGFPVSAVVTTKKIADRLGGSVGYFNTVIFRKIKRVSLIEELKSDHLITLTSLSQ